jgi:putative hydrolase of the HAD superfamily
MIRTIFFDFGNVLAFFDHGRAIREFAKFTDMDPVELGLQLYGGPLEDDYEHGHITTAEYVRDAILNGRLKMTSEAFLKHFVDIFWINPEVCDLIPKLKPRYRVVLASNTNDAHFTQYTGEFAHVLKHFDHLVASHLVRARKPHDAFFDAAKKQARAEPHECVFVDDLPVNIEAANRAGLHGIVYLPDDTLATRLRKLGVDV